MGLGIRHRTSRRRRLRQWRSLAMVFLYALHIGFPFPLTSILDVDLNLPVTAVALALTIVFMQLPTPSGTIGSKLAQMDWMWVFSRSVLCITYWTAKWKCTVYWQHHCVCYWLDVGWCYSSMVLRPSVDSPHRWRCRLWAVRFVRSFGRDESYCRFLYNC